MIDLFRHQSKKDLNDAVLLQSLFGQLNNKYSSFTSIYTDGSKVLDRVASAAFVPNINRKLQRRIPGLASIYTAELQAIKMALELAQSTSGQSFIIYTDSLSSLQALSGSQYTHPFILDILNTYTQLINHGYEIVLAWVPSHVGIKGNEKVDIMAKEALNLPLSSVKIPYSDIKPSVNSYIRNKWQTLWDELPDNKLFQIEPAIGVRHLSVSSNCMREEIVLARIRVGHTYFTNSYLLKDEDPPFCIACNKVFTVHHVSISEFSLCIIIDRDL